MFEPNWFLYSECVKHINNACVDRKIILILIGYLSLNRGELAARDIQVPGRHFLCNFNFKVFVFFLRTETNFFRVLYNSSMTFRERLYVSLDVDLTRIRLHQPISNIVKQPFLYVRDMLPRNCFLAVTKLHEVGLSFFHLNAN